MASSKVSSMLLFLLLLVLVFPHMDKALGEERQLHELKGTEHPDQLMTVGRSLLFRIPPCPPSLCKPRPIRIPPRLRTPPPPPRH
ncbi:hypothetical protein Bca4012_101222 [Brassica carinata]|uniref:Uncharacterized protein n=3 Tax=Brassica TaxID=3705 RepID=A0A0D3CYQ6_BRAOL|nr:hypothetical protein HID58_096035 [Brassica napus]VDD63736.1 unnamed protein product [Brassica oleracea]KAH0849849.1 hypothetical protein HID58_096036 [Brassica napus]KAH0851732.1 hypothetical protein HID58_090185 [Brassica napus]CAF2063387.1 unnamed protein product [Brassica napus]